jgi:hypothetical protein
MENIYCIAPHFHKHLVRWCEVTYRPAMNEAVGWVFRRSEELFAEYSLPEAPAADQYVKTARRFQYPFLFRVEVVGVDCEFFQL